MKQYGYCLLIILSMLFSASFAASNQNIQYKKIFDVSRQELNHLLTNLNDHRPMSQNQKISILIQYLQDKPYIHIGAAGEGDWQPNSWIYKPGAIHSAPYPVYRLDGFDCQTLVEVLLAILHAKNLDEFDTAFLHIAYGGANIKSNNIVSYINRNHFVDSDFNPINQQNGYLKDISKFPSLTPYINYENAIVMRNKWLKQQNPKVNINSYAITAQKKVLMSYIPKHMLITTSAEGYKENLVLFKLLPTPAILEVIQDPRKWFLNGVLLQKNIGTQLTVSHMGVLYRQKFKKFDLIYYKIYCNQNSKKNHYCYVTPIYCRQKTCNELMFASATNAYPNQYLWYKNNEGSMVCRSKKPQRNIKYTTCNRVEAKPLQDYLTEYQDGFYLFMQQASILGIHIEAIAD